MSSLRAGHLGFGVLTWSGLAGKAETSGEPQRPRGDRPSVSRPAAARRAARVLRPGILPAGLGPRPEAGSQRAGVRPAPASRQRIFLSCPPLACPPATLQETLQETLGPDALPGGVVAAGAGSPSTYLKLQ